ncbi:cytochrome b/b6 domain-containing protein [Microcella alkalica]|uniref:Thiosulfate reductase cytochrome b subunit n=1 Tax=Microcella alkalica TaxID=355930 RepID=A0A839E2G4_9MICO|nr:thiosulfate reductase cytochrome b subunit [Microcella alkalica]
MPRPTALRRRAVVLAVVAALVVLAAAMIAARAFLESPSGASFVADYPGSYDPPPGTPDGFPAWLRWTHWLSAFLLLFIVSSGLHLRTGRRPPAFVTRRTTGPLAAKSPSRLGLHTWWHLVVDTLWVITGLIYLVALFASGHWQRLIPTDLAVIPHAVSAAVQYLALDWPAHDSWARYNSLQQLFYAATVVIAAPLATLTGLRLSPVWPDRWMRARGPLSDRAARRTHGLVLWYFLAFTVAHVALVLLTGARGNLNAIYAGIDDAESWLGVGLFALSTGVMAAAWVLLRPPAQIAIAQRVADVRVMPAPPAAPKEAHRP